MDFEMDSTNPLEFFIHALSQICTNEHRFTALSIAVALQENILKRTVNQRIHRRKEKKSWCSSKGLHGLPVFSTGNTNGEPVAIAGVEVETAKDPAVVGIVLLRKDYSRAFRESLRQEHSRGTTSTRGVLGRNTKTRCIHDLRTQRSRHTHKGSSDSGTRKGGESTDQNKEPLWDAATGRLIWHNTKC